MTHIFSVLGHCSLGCNLQVLELENILEPGISLSFLGGKGSCKFNMRLRGFFITCDHIFGRSAFL